MEILQGSKVISGDETSKNHLNKIDVISHIPKPDEKIERSASIKIAEDVLMLEISHQFHHYYVLPVIAETVLSKIQLLKRLDFLPALSNVERLVIGNQMLNRSFSMNQFLLKEGSIPTSFFIIEDGTAEVVWTKKWTRKNDLNVNNRRRVHESDADKVLGNNK